jgi:putative hemolysin
MTLITFAFALATLFFSVNAIALRIFSVTKLQEAFGARRGEEKHKKHFQSLLANSERLHLVCSLYRLIFNICILAIVLMLFARSAAGPMGTVDYIKAFAAAAAIVVIFSLVIPHAWAKYAGEKILSRTHELLFFFASLASPVLFFFKLHDRLVRRLAGTVETSPQEQQEEKEEEFLTELEQHKIYGAVDAEEQMMIEGVLQLSERYASEIMTPRTDIVAVEVNSDLQSVLKAITAAGHSRFPVYEGNIDNIVGLIYAKDLLNEIGK